MPTKILRNLKPEKVLKVVTERIKTQPFQFPPGPKHPDRWLDLAAG
jgi:hypothetical protein